MNKNILITGISGFVGQNLVKYFSSYEIYTLYGLDIVYDDISGVDKIYSWDQLEDLKDIDVVIHLAGKAHDLKNTSDEKSYFDVNYGLTKKVFDWYHKSSATQFLMMSSVKAVADIVSGELTEEFLPNPITAYGKSKIKAEDYLNSIVLPENKNLYIFRPAMIHGPGNKGNLNLLYNLVSKGIPWPLASFENKRSFVSVANLCFIFKSFIDRDINSGTYNIADEKWLSTNKLIEIISQGVGRKPRLWYFPKSVVIFMAKLGDVLHLPLNTERLNKLTEDYVVSTTKLQAVLGVNLPHDAEVGIKNTISSFSDKTI
ncbi:NAD-dependent epimerase/dehydratase family protein [Ancylomarina salipaludis]|uniref:NAD-dependent epimerase/dehydratase family protein n=1 Tax=Ancylomarina salipaludis TaxID=2501299 RepID=A0A4Q1JLN4_9BACT|nr:NAD-dependent epimerase/dehydratase family protein [Ancylomarina salipaludis]RXQ93855.1 NAD-dependent epimerase/dehydratase family protein [Ancylomarina salipaludis]